MAKSDKIVIKAESAHDWATGLVAATRARDLNEADTRHQVIDVVLHGVLSWPRNLTKVESLIEPGYADYMLRREDESPLILIEAKREGIYFHLPNGDPNSVASRHIKVKTLMTDPKIKDSILQVQRYCVDAGCPFAAVTNGREWIFFRTFQNNQDWRNLQAFVIPCVEYFSDRFTEAVNSIGYKAIAEQGALSRLLGHSAIENREVFYPKKGIAAYSTSIYQNRYAQQLRPIVDRYFSQLDERDITFMEDCYVSDKKYQAAFQNARSLLKDAITPYMEQYGIKQIEDTRDGGSFSTRLQKSIRERRGTDVLVLFGGKGVGKSTFLRRLLFHRTPQYLKKHMVASIIDLLDEPELKESLHKTIWTRLLDDLDRTGLLKADRPALLQLLADRFERARKQELYGLEEGSEAYNVQLNQLVQKWLDDKKYCAKKLTEYWKSNHRAVIVVIDNTDQFDTSIQEFCFQIAQEISAELQCLVIISMREERFYASSVKGTLDAFHNAGFHISSPPPIEVFERRLKYVIGKLSTKRGRDELLGDNVIPETSERISKLFRTLAHEFAQSQSHLANFLSACAHGNIRIALQMFREFVLSRYTNVTEITSVKGTYWTIILHQVLKPIMIPYRFFYDEAESQVPNVYDIRSRKNGSHFTALRILARLAVGDPLNRPYVAVPTLQAEFAQTFAMGEDFQLNIDMLLKFRLVEANNRIEEYRPELDSIRITNYGTYLYSDMYTFFTYIDLVCVDCAILDQEVANALTALSNQEFMLWEAGLDDRGRRIKRVEKRLEKTERFINYLNQEEQREIAFYALHGEPRIVPAIAEKFAKEKIQVLHSATKQRY